MPVDQRRGLGLDAYGGLVAGVGVTDLCVAVLDEQPEVPVAARLVHELERDHDPARGAAARSSWTRHHAQSANPGSVCSGPTSTQRSPHPDSASITPARSRPASVSR